MSVPLSGVQHVGVTVGNLERSLQFYERALRIVPDAVTATPRAKLAFVRTGNVLLELIEYAMPDDRIDATASAPGAVHICFEVDDLQSTYDKLTADGFRFDSPPSRHEIEGLGRFASTFFADPDGVRLELFQSFDRETG
jgi:catechol 2,3-dioxygenase-like lactoylglutathione lyase family enzyme